MKLSRIPAIVGVVVILVVGLGYLLFSMKDRSEFSPVRPANVSPKAVWAGGPEGGVWALLEHSGVPDQYEVTLYDESGRLWVSGEFWNSQQVVVSPEEIAQFDGGQLYLKTGSFLLPVRQQKRSFSDGTTITIAYPEPSAEYTDARDLTKRLLDSSTVKQATP